MFLVGAEGAEKPEVIEKRVRKMAGTTGLEPATSDVTGRRSNQLNYDSAFSKKFKSNVSHLKQLIW